MPKMKSNSGARKRFKVTGSGKIVHRKAWGGHYYESKTKPRRRRLRGNKVVDRADRQQVRRLLGE